MVILLLGTLSTACFSKNLEGKVGAGLTIMDFNHAAALSVRFHPNHYLAINALGGFDTDQSKNATIFGAQVQRSFSLEENLNFFLGTGLYIISDKGGVATASNATGLEVDGLLGAEFFFQGISNLGFQFQTGVGLRTLRKTSLKVLGDGFAGFGIHYYL